eukprot:gene19564-biopygen31693
MLPCGAAPRSAAVIPTPSSAVHLPPSSCPRHRGTLFAPGRRGGPCGGTADARAHRPLTKLVLVWVTIKRLNDNSDLVSVIPLCCVACGTIAAPPAPPPPSASHRGRCRARFTAVPAARASVFPGPNLCEAAPTNPQNLAAFPTLPAARGARGGAAPCTTPRGAIRRPAAAASGFAACAAARCGLAGSSRHVAGDLPPPPPPPNSGMRVARTAAACLLTLQARLGLAPAPPRPRPARLISSSSAPIATFDPASTLVSYVDRGNCGPRGDDANADLSQCRNGSFIVREVPFIYTYDVVASYNGCDYFAYTVYESVTGLMPSRQIYTRRITIRTARFVESQPRQHRQQRHLLRLVPAPRPLSCNGDLSTWMLHGAVCGESDDGWACVSNMDVVDATVTCEGVGARLCSATEVVPAAMGTGCGHDERGGWRRRNGNRVLILLYVWTATPCDNGYVRVKGNNADDTQCALDGDTTNRP